MTIKRNAGIDTEEDVKRIYTYFSGHPLPEKSGGIGSTGLFFVSLAMIVFGIVIGIVIIPGILHKNESSDIVVTPMPTVNIPIQTVPIVIDTPVQNESSPTDNNTTDIENKTKALMDAAKNNATTTSSVNDTGNPLTNATATVIPNSS